MKTLIDSNILIYAAKPEYEAVRAFIIENPPAISIITKVEVLGFHRLGIFENHAVHSLLEFLEIIYLSDSTFEKAIELRQRQKMSLADSLIAATCMEHNLMLATNNLKDFDWIKELRLTNPTL